MWMIYKAMRKAVKKLQIQNQSRKYKITHLIPQGPQKLRQSEIYYLPSLIGQAMNGTFPGLLCVEPDVSYICCVERNPGYLVTRNHLVW